MPGPYDSGGRGSERAVAAALAFVCVTLVGAGPEPTHEELIGRAAGWSGLGRAAFVSVKPDMAVAIIGREGPGRTGGVVRNIELHGEVTNEAAAKDFGYRSIRSQVDIDCSSRRDRVVRIDFYADHSLRGRSRTRRTPGDWAHPSPNAYLSDVIDAVCAPAPAGLRVAEAGALTAPAALTASPAPGAVRAESGPPAPAVIKVADATPAKPLRSAPVPAPRPATKSASMPVLALALAPGIAAPESTIAAQIAASSSAAGAALALRSVRGRLPAGANGKVVAATVNGRQVYRAIVQGFASNADARQFCQAQRKAGEDCWVR